MQLKAFRGQMFKKILVAINPTDHEEAEIVKIASLEAIKHKAKLHLLYLGYEHDLELEIKKYAEECVNQGIEVHYEPVEFEGTHEEIPAKIAELTEGYDLVIMGHRKFEKIYRFTHQSTAADLINLISIPVLIVPRERLETEFQF